MPSPPPVRLLGAALAASFACALLPAAAADRPPYEIDAVLSLTGSAAFLGTEQRQALGAVEKVVNAKGGIHGRKLVFAIQDDQSSPQVAVQLTNGIIAKKVPVLLGSSLVAQCSAMAALVKENGPVQYCFSPGIHPEHGSYTFSTSVSTRDQAIAFVRYFKAHKWSRVGLLTSTDATGQDAERNFLEALGADSGFQIVAREHFAPSDVSVSAQVARVKGASPQVVVAWCTGTPFGTVLHGISDGGLETPIVGGNGNVIYAEMKQFKAFLPKTLMFAGVQAFRNPGQIQGPLRGAIDAYQKALAPAHPDLGQSLAYDPAMIVVSVLNRLPENAGARQVRDALLDLHGYVGIDGVYDFHTGDNRGLAVGNVVLLRYDGGRELFTPISKPGGQPL